jgi:hypothetical protein
MVVLSLLSYGCAQTTKNRTIQPDGSVVEKACTDRPPTYTTSVESQLKAALPLPGKNEIEAESLVKVFLSHQPGGTQKGEDLANYMFYICQMSNSQKWSEGTTERLINRFIDKWDVGEAEAKKPKVEITFNDLSQKELIKQFPIPLVLKPTRTAILTFVVGNVGDGPILNSHASVYVVPDTVRVDKPETAGVYIEKRNHNHYAIKGKPSLLPMEMSNERYTFKAEVWVPEGTDRFDLRFKIYAENLQYQELVLVFRPIHYKRPEAN